MLLLKPLDMVSIVRLFLMEVRGHRYGNMNIFQEMEQEQGEDGQIYQLIFLQIILLHLIISMLKDHMIF